MSNISNPWLTPLQRSYQQIKTKLIEKLKELKGENGEVLITDYSEGNIFILILSIFAAIAETLHYYIDNMARESFFSTARRYESLVKHGKLVDYHPHGAVASMVDVVLYRASTSTYIETEVNIVKGSVFTDNSGNQWLASKDTLWSKGTTVVTIPLIQHELYVDRRMIGVKIPDSKPSLSINIPTLGNGKYYENGTMSLSIKGESWVLVDTFAFSKYNDKHFRVEVDSEMNLSIIFGDGVHGYIPEVGNYITECSYYITSGSKANISSNHIVNVPNTIKSQVQDATCSNPYAAGGGSDYEDFDKLKQNIPLHIRTRGVAVTKQDFIDLAKQVPGVNKVAIDYECGRKLNIYITPDSGVIAGETLLERVYEILKQNSPITSWLNVKPVGQVDIILDIDVTGKKSYSVSEIQNQVTQALRDAYSISNSEIGGNVRISDIYALIDNLPSVDFLHINQFYMKPWPTTIIGAVSLIISTFNLDPSTTGSNSYFITILENNRFNISSYKRGINSNYNIGDPVLIEDTYNGVIFGITISDNTYVPGNKYKIDISAPNVDYIEPGFNLPVFINPSDQLKLKVNEVL